MRKRPLHGCGGDANQVAVRHKTSGILEQRAGFVAVHSHAGLPQYLKRCLVDLLALLPVHQLQAGDCAR